MPEDALRFVRGYGVLPVVYFFILSGFILATVYLPRIEERGESGLDRSDYFWARVARILPLLLASLVPGIFYHALWLARGGSGRFPLTQSVERGVWGFELNGIAFNALLRSNVPSWTLSAELIFYVVFPFVIPGVIYWTRDRLQRGLTWSLLVYGAIQVFVGSVELLAEGWWKAAAFGVGHFGSPIFVPCFMAGIFLGVLTARGWTGDWIRERAGSIYLAVGAIALAMTQFEDPLLPPAMLTSVLAPLFCLAIIGATGELGTVNRWMSLPAMQFLGAASYAIYITHWPVKEIAQFYMTGSELQPVVRALIVVAWVMAVGIGAHLWIEKPAHRAVMRWVSARRAARSLA